MKVRKILIILLILALIVWGFQTIYILYNNVSAPDKIKRQFNKERKMIRLEFLNKQRKLKDEYRQKKYLATGKTVYDRVFNTKDQTLVELIQRMAEESFPRGWSCHVRVEEFTQFLLLVYVPHNLDRVNAEEIVPYIVPIVKYCNWCLSDVAVFDSTHKSYLFFDNETLKHIEIEGQLTNTLLAKVKKQGESFTQFNSTTIQCEKFEQHLILPVEIIGPSGVETCIAFFDTGASTTTVSYPVISKTGQDDLLHARRETFNTANGLMSCPIVYREVNIEGFRKRIEVAVNQNDEINLLGMNYFEGMKYIIDPQNACIYIWEEISNKIPRLTHDELGLNLNDLAIPVEVNNKD